MENVLDIKKDFAEVAKRHNFDTWLGLPSAIIGSAIYDWLMNKVNEHMRKAAND